MPQLVIRTDDLTGIHQVGWDEWWRSPPALPATWPWPGRPLQGCVTGVVAGEPGVSGVLVAGDDGPGPAGLGGGVWLSRAARFLG